MNIYKNRFLLTVIYLLFLSTSLVAESSVWKVSKDNKYFYVGGTVHLLEAKDHPLPKEFMSAYNDASEVIFETDLIKTNSPEFQEKIFKLMLNASNKTLQDTLSKKTYTNVKQYLTKKNMPIANFEQFHPWAVALVLTTLGYESLGMLPQYGVDFYFNQKAFRDKKKISSLESIEEQLSFIQSFGDVEPNLMINYTLRDLEKLQEYTSFLKKSWRAGDMKSFTSHSLINQMKDEFPTLYASLITKRNNNWMKKLLQLNSNTSVEFVLVGTMHLPGDDGLLLSLKKQGYTIEQIQ